MSSVTRPMLNCAADNAMRKTRTSRRISVITQFHLSLTLSAGLLDLSHPDIKEAPRKTPLARQTIPNVTRLTVVSYTHSIVHGGRPTEKDNTPGIMGMHQATSPRLATVTNGSQVHRLGASSGIRSR